MADPIVKFRSWYKAAARAGSSLPDAMALATADRRGRPSVRYVLLKEADQRGFVFYTNARSRKGRELAANPHAALAFYWDLTGKQVRIEGRVELVGTAASDEYWLERPAASRFASAASDQSTPIGSRAELIARYRALVQKYGGAEMPRPSHWQGYRLLPDRIEFWTRREPRLHHRELFTRVGKGWKSSLLQP